VRKFVVVVLLVAIIFLAGCEVQDNGSRMVGVEQPSAMENALVVYTLCVDSVVCYYHPSGYAGGMDCFRDTDLVEKYCGE
jgi:hypothetical protein